MAKQPAMENPRAGGCWCNQFEENMWRKDVCVSCFHKKSDHTNAIGICNFRKPPATKGAHTDEAKKVASSSSTTLSTPSLVADPPVMSNASKRIAVQISASSIVPSVTTSSPTSTRRPSNAASINSASSPSIPSSSLTPPAPFLAPSTSNGAISSKSNAQSRATQRPVSQTTYAAPSSVSNVRLAGTSSSPPTSPPSPSPTLASSPSSPPPHRPASTSSPPAPRNVTNSALSVLQRYPYAQAQQSTPTQPTPTKTHKKTPSQNNQPPASPTASNATGKGISQTKSFPFRTSRAVTVGASFDVKGASVPSQTISYIEESPATPLSESDPIPPPQEHDETDASQTRYRNPSPPAGQRQDTAPDTPQRGPSFSELYTEPAQQALQPPPKQKRKSVLRILFPQC